MAKYKTTYNKEDRCSVLESGDIVTISECLDNEYYITIDLNTGNKKSYHQSQLKLMKQKEFEVGDVVTLKGDVVRMTIQSIDKGIITTVWHCSETDGVLEHTFKSAVLKKVDDIVRTKPTYGSYVQTIPAINTSPLTWKSTATYSTNSAESKSPQTWCNSVTSN